NSEKITTGLPHPKVVVAVYEKVQAITDTDTPIPDELISEFNLTTQRTVKLFLNGVASKSTWMGWLNKLKLRGDEFGNNEWVLQLLATPQSQDCRIVPVDLVLEHFVQLNRAITKVDIRAINPPVTRDILD
ncbi:UNVERIFIED_CONTAM: hypothetical protein HDU68_006107, partial [Siphonaria sp. JEL0065]